MKQIRFLLIAVMLLLMVPALSLAEYEYSIPYIDRFGEEQTAQMGQIITEKDKYYYYGILVAKGHVTISEISNLRDVTIILMDDATLEITNGLNLNGGTITVYAQKNNTGKLNIRGQDGVSSSSRDGTSAITGNLVVYGGTVTLNGGKGASSYDANGRGGNGVNGNLTVGGNGTVSADGGSGGTARYSCQPGGSGITGDLTVLDNGSVTASGGYGGNSAAPGAAGVNGNVTVSGNGQAELYGASGATNTSYHIYAGAPGIGGNLTVSENGTVTAVGGNGSQGNQGYILDDGGNGGAGVAGDLRASGHAKVMSTGGNGGPADPLRKPGIGGNAVDGNLIISDEAIVDLNNGNTPDNLDPDLPKTGDNTPLLLLYIMAVVSGTGVVFFIRRNKQRG